MDPITHTITEIELENGERIFLAPTGARNIVSIEGSVLGGWGSLPRTHAEVPLITAEILDAGTSRHTKDQIRESLAECGASISFKDGADRTFFSASCFPEDVAFVLSIISECLGEPLLPISEVRMAKKRAQGELEESLTDTRTQAAHTLSRLLFPASHVNYIEPTKTRMASLEKVSRLDVASFQRTLGKKNLVLAITGDIEISKARRAAEKAFGTLSLGTAPTEPDRPNKKDVTPNEVLVPIKDKATIDAYFGTTIPFTYDSPEYRPFIVLSSMLGGRGLASGHLMRTIRERDGYTYGIYAGQSGFLKNTQGAFRIWATFSPATFAEAVAATKREIRVFLRSGITEEALLSKKDEMVGNYLISISTTRGLASALHSLGVEGKPLSYIDEYPSLLRAVTVPDLTKLTSLIVPENLSLAASGTFPKK